MKKALKFLLAVIAILLLLSVVFYYWASAATLPQESYSKIINKPIKAAIDQDSIYSIITYNVGYLSGMTNNKAVNRTEELFSNNLNRLKQQLKNYNPDIIAFQEIDFDADRSYHVNQMEEVSGLGYPYAAQAINWDERYLPFPYGLPNKHFGQVISGQSVNSKYKIVSQERHVLTRVEDSPFYRDAFYLDRLAQVVKLTIEDIEVVVINIHLEAFDKPTRDIQAQTVLDMYNSYRHKYPTILLGDFNSDPKTTDAAINLFLNLDNTGNAAYRNNNIKNTFNSENPTERIDYIFYNTNFIEYVDGNVLDSFGDISDHLPVEMRFRLKR